MKDIPYGQFISRVWLLGLLLLVGQARAQNLLPIDPLFFHVDSVKKIILVNASTKLLNAEGTSFAGVSSGGHTYALDQPVASVSTEKAYQVTRHDSAYTLYFTRIPVLSITTRYQIIDTPSVYARLVLVDTSGVKAQSGMGIEWRGMYSQTFPKKSYELSLWADTLGAKENDLSLLGMRTSDKWNLQAMYNDPLRSRIKVANEVWQSMDQLYYQAQEPTAKNGIALAYAEVFLNESYRGIYTLTERVDRKQLQLKKYTSNTIEGELYKGVSAAGGATIFSDAPAFNNADIYWGGFEYKEPSEQTDWTNLHAFVDFVVNSTDADFYSQYPSKFNLANAVDYYIFLNLMRATDNTAKNLYIAKYKPGEPYYYVPWDLDGVLGDNWQGVNYPITNDILTNGFYTRLLNDCAATGFRAALVQRWATLRASVLTQAAIVQRFTADNAYLVGSNVFAREQRAWPDYQYDPTQLTYAATWLEGRLAYLDGVFSQGCPAPLATTPTSPAAELVAVQDIFPFLCMRLIKL